MIWVGLAAVLAVASSPATATGSQSSTVESAAPVSETTAAALARIVAPADLMIPAELEEARKGVLMLPSVDPNSKQLENDYPGIFEAVWVSIEPEMRKWAEADQPNFWVALKQLYMSRLTESEAQAIIAFYQSPTGQKLLKGMIANFDATPALADIANSPSSKVSAEQFKAATDAAKTKVLEQLGADDTETLFKLVGSVSLEKFKSLGVETQKLTVDWINREDSEADKRLEAATVAAMEQYMKLHPPKK